MKKKNEIKKILIRVGLWRMLSLLRSFPEILSWRMSGFSGAAPHPVKMMTVKSYLKMFSIKKFVETGTYLGDTLDYISKAGIQCTSIELSKELYNDACNRFFGIKNIKLLHGNSGQVLPELVNKINEPTLFWLDGHYSAGVTAGAEMHTPVSVELESILNHPIKKHVILIDDARCFDGTNDYPHLDSLLRNVREEGSYSAEVTMDIIRLVPRS